MSPKDLPTLTEEQLTSFWLHVDLLPDGCWPWTGSTTGIHQRAVFYVNNNSFYAARIMYKIAACDPGKLFVLHKCDNVLCVNPDHLWVGTKTDNNKDRDSKGRHVALQGEDHGMAKLTQSNIIDIRRSTLTQRQLAKKYGVSQSTIWRALRTHWKSIC